MSTDLLFEQFATLATAPDGIARLRELILLFAVQGKLGTNDPKELPIKIDESKKRIRNIKSQNGDSSRTQIIDIFPPDSMPMNWRKTTLGSVGIWSTGGTPSRQMSNYFDGGIPWIKSGDLNDGIVTKTDETISQLGLDNSNAKLLPKGTISIALYGATIGKLGILGIESTTNQACANCVINEKIITTRYLFYFLRSQKSYFIQVGQGGAQPNITNWIIWEWPIVIPPLTEQHRIIEKIDRLMTLCDELEARQQQERAGCLKLGTASLAGLQNAESQEEFGRQWVQVCDAFDLILDCPENVAVLRQTILQLAVLGQMDTHDPKDEPVEKIIERIRKAKERLVKDGKIKPEKILESGNEIEIPFSIPKTWKWMKLSAISAFVTDGDHYPPQRVLKGIPHLTAKNVRDKKLNLIGCTFISHEDFEKVKMRYEPREDDVIITCVGTIGQTAIVPPNFVFSADRNLAAIRLINGTFLPKFLQMILNASYWQNKVMTGSESTAQPHLYLKDLRLFCIPLPPLAEQHRIVAKVDALMALCDALESRLKERAGVHGRLAEAVVKQVAG